MTASPTRPPSRRALQRILREWRAVPVGTDVIVHREAGPPLLTRTRCQPYLLADGTPAILVRDMATHVPLWRIELAEKP